MILKDQVLAKSESLTDAFFVICKYTFRLLRLCELFIYHMSDLTIEAFSIIYYVNSERLNHRVVTRYDPHQAIILCMLERILDQVGYNLQEALLVAVKKLW